MKTSDLIDAALDWAVAEARGVHSDIGVNGRPWEPPYSTDWAQGGPIIERESIRLMPDQGATYVDCVWLAGNANEDGDEFNGKGPTPLIAAMRCFVASKLGEEVDVPEALA